MHTVPIRHSAGQHAGPISRHSAQRWGRWFVSIWIGILVSTALLPYCEVAAAVVTHEQAMYANCDHPAGQAPDSGGDRKTGTCLGIAASATAPVNMLSAPTGGNLTPLAPGISAPLHVLAQLPALPAAYRAAPPPAAPYLRNLRLLI